MQARERLAKHPSIHEMSAHATCRRGLYVIVTRLIDLCILLLALLAHDDALHSLSE